MKPLAIAGFVAAGLGLAYVVHASTQTPGDKAKVGDTVRVPMTKVLVVTSAGMNTVPLAKATDVGSIQVTSSSYDYLYGTLRAVANSLGSIGVPTDLATPGSIAILKKDVLA